MSIKLVELGFCEILNFEYPPQYSISKISRRDKSNNDNSSSKELLSLESNINTRMMIMEDSLSFTEFENLPVRKFNYKVFDLILNSDCLILSLGSLEDKVKFHERKSSDIEDGIRDIKLYCDFMRSLLRFYIVHNESKRSFPKVFFISSTAGECDGTYPDHELYSVSKTAIGSLLKNLSKTYNFELDIIYPPMIDSEMSKYRGMSKEYFFKNLFLPQLNKFNGV